MKKKMGRPIIGTQPAEVFFAARFTPQEAKQINGAIRQARQSKSEWIRENLLSAANDDEKRITNKNQKLVDTNQNMR
jgi:hypothetical protein